MLMAMGWSILAPGLTKIEDTLMQVVRVVKNMGLNLDLHASNSELVLPSNKALILSTKTKASFNTTPDTAIKPIKELMHKTFPVIRCPNNTPTKLNGMEYRTMEGCAFFSKHSFPIVTFYLDKYQRSTKVVVFSCYISFRKATHLHHSLFKLIPCHPVTKVPLYCYLIKVKFFKTNLILACKYPKRLAKF